MLYLLNQDNYLKAIYLAHHHLTFLFSPLNDILKYVSLNLNFIPSCMILQDLIFAKHPYFKSLEYHLLIYNYLNLLCYWIFLPFYIIKHINIKWKKYPITQ
jgi:hypothetical protein